MTGPHFRPLGFGEILDGAFTLYRRNFVTFVVTALVPTLALVQLVSVIGTAAGATASSDPAQMASAFGRMMLTLFIAALVYIVMWAALTREASQAYLGQPATLGDGLRMGVRKLLPILGAGIVIFIALFAAYMAVALIFVMIAGAGAASGSQGMSVMFVLVAAVVAAAAYLLMVALLFGVLPAIIVEDKGPLQAIGRSFDLARGDLPRVVGLMLVTLIIVYLPIVAVVWLTGGFADMANPQAAGAGQFGAQQLLSTGVGVLTTPFMAAVIVMLYFDRRVRTEALDVQMAADRLAPAS